MAAACLANMFEETGSDEITFEFDSTDTENYSEPMGEFHGPEKIRIVVLKVCGCENCELIRDFEDGTVRPPEGFREN